MEWGKVGEGVGRDDVGGVGEGGGRRRNHQKSSDNVSFDGEYDGSKMFGAMCHMNKNFNQTAGQVAHGQ